MRVVLLKVTPEGTEVSPPFRRQLPGCGCTPVQGVGAGGMLRPLRCAGSVPSSAYALSGPRSRASTRPSTCAAGCTVSYSVKR